MGPEPLGFVGLVYGRVFDDSFVEPFLEGHPGAMRGVRRDVPGARADLRDLPRHGLFMPFAAGVAKRPAYGTGDRAEIIRLAW
jgi:hypothetical protein